VDEVVAIVPLRSPGAGKTRLAPGLGPESRAALAGAMLADVVAALRGADLHVVVAAGGPTAAAAASALAVEVVLDAPHVRGLDDAVDHARQHVGPVGGLLVVQADLPLLTTDDVRCVLDPDAAVVVAPSADGGTSALLRRPPTVIPTAYGPGSAHAHQRMARAAEATLATIERPGLAHDVDVLDDLRRLDLGQVGPATAAVLAAVLDEASDCA
jgi:2-phospho-L-lactate/phosphoenolpyruvate guanylyltransferase